MPPTAREKCQSGSAKRRPSRSATGRAPIATMSRRIPPTPVAAPWNGSTADGWLWLSTLNATASPSPRSSTPAFSPGPCSTRSPVARQPLQEQRGVLVAAVLRPEEREHRELEVVRIAPEQRADALVLPVGEAECAMERRFRDAAQKVSLPTASDLTCFDERGRAVASVDARVLADAPPARGDLGRLVPVHQGRGRGHRARGR